MNTLTSIFQLCNSKKLHLGVAGHESCQGNTEGKRPLPAYGSSKAEQTHFPDIQSRTSPLHAQFSFDDCSVPLNFFKYITSDSSLRLSQQPYYRFFPPTEWCCLCDPLISVLVKYCRFPFLYTVTSRFSGSIIH